MLRLSFVSAPRHPHLHRHCRPHLHRNCRPHLHRNCRPHLHRNCRPHLHRNCRPHLHRVVLGDETETTDSTHPEDGLLDILDSNQNAMQPPPGRDPQVRDQRRAWKPRIILQSLYSPSEDFDSPYEHLGTHFRSNFK
jgi:hypothetical protein